MEAYKELGKQLLNIGIAVIVFVIIQPFVSEKADIKLVIIGFTKKNAKMHLFLNR